MLGCCCAGWQKGLKLCQQHTHDCVDSVDAPAQMVLPLPVGAHTKQFSSLLNSEVNTCTYTAQHKVIHTNYGTHLHTTPIKMR
jgi:hypothetical protein